MSYYYYVVDSENKLILTLGQNDIQSDSIEYECIVKFRQTLDEMGYDNYEPPTHKELIKLDLNDIHNVMDAYKKMFDLTCVIFSYRWSALMYLWENNFGKNDKIYTIGETELHEGCETTYKDYKVI